MERAFWNLIRRHLYQFIKADMELSIEQRSHMCKVTQVAAELR